MPTPWKVKPKRTNSAAASSASDTTEAECDDKNLQDPNRPSADIKGCNPAITAAIIGALAVAFAGIVSSPSLPYFLMLLRGEMATNDVPIQSIASPEFFKGHDEASSYEDKPVLLADPKGPRDPLTCIKGIGEVYQEELYSNGIYHFWQIAKWTSQNLAWIQKNTLKIMHHANKNWIKQAKLLVDKGGCGMTKQ